MKGVKKEAVMTEKKKAFDIENLLAVWTTESKSDTTVVIAPDGCQDIIMRSTVGEKHQWFVSSLYDQANTVSVKAGSRMMGLRMKPGVRIDEQKLLTSILQIPGHHYLDMSELCCRLYSFTDRKRSVEDALDCLASEVNSIAHAAKRIGVSQRCLQRLLIRETGRSPIYWMLLVRMRRAARALLEPTPLVEIADRFGYADQAHMSRECKRWFGMSPSGLRCMPEIIKQLNDVGYD